MKLNTLLAATVLTLAGAAGAHEHAHEPKHGGIVVETKELDQELVARPAVIQLYVTNHGKPVDVSKASAKVTLLAGTEKQEVELKPAGDKLEATGSFKTAAGTKAVVVVTGASKSASTARFTLK